MTKTNYAGRACFLKYCALRLARLLWLALLISPVDAWSAPVRVTAWSLQDTGADTRATNGPQDHIQQAAEALKKLDPDVVILQRVRDWQMCTELARALKPADYHVLICSSFHDADASAASKQQVAILAKDKAYFSWSQAWEADQAGPVPGGFAFAAVRVGGRSLGIFAVEAADNVAAVGAGIHDSASLRLRGVIARQWAEEFKSFKSWVTNRVEAVVVSGGFCDNPNGSASGGQRNGAQFDAILLSEPLDRLNLLPGSGGISDAKADYMHANLGASSDVLPGVILDRCPATCDLELIATKLSPDTLAQIELPLIKPPAAATPSTQAAAPKFKLIEPAPAVQLQPPVAVAPAVRVVAQAEPVKPVFGWLPGLAGGVLALLVFLFFWVHLKRKPAISSAGPVLISVKAESGGGVSLAETGRIVITPQSVTGSVTANAGVSPAARPIVRVESGGAARSQAEEWKRRALAAEQRAEQAQTAIRGGLITWLKQKLQRKLISDRAQLLESQETATLKAMAVDERLAKIEFQLQEQNAAYERRIEELTRELAVAKEENRELIRAKIAQVKAEMEAARAKARRMQETV